jgi:hypothetical protein
LVAVFERKAIGENASAAGSRAKITTSFMSGCNCQADSTRKTVFLAVRSHLNFPAKWTMYLAVKEQSWFLTFRTPHQASSKSVLHCGNHADYHDLKIPSRWIPKGPPLASQ